MAAARFGDGAAVQAPSLRGVFSKRPIQGLALRPSIAHACDKCIEIGTGGPPFERTSEALEVALELFQPLGDRC